MTKTSCALDELIDSLDKFNGNPISDNHRNEGSSSDDDKAEINNVVIEFDDNKDVLLESQSGEEDYVHPHNAMKTLLILLMMENPKKAPKTSFDDGDVSDCATTGV